MIERSNYACPLCRLERDLMARFEAHLLPGYCGPILESSCLAAFPSVFALLAHLRTCGQQPDGHRSADQIFLELLRLPATESCSTADEIFIVAFLPTIHLTMRRVLENYPELSPDDTAHQMLLFLLQFLHSKELRLRESYFAFAIARKLRRSAFDWAKHQCRVRPSNGHAELAAPMIESSLESFERLAFLRHFLNSCVAKGWLDADELDLLIQFKVDGLSGEDLSSLEGLSPNALRQRVKRLLGKLRLLAREGDGSRARE